MNKALRDQVLQLPADERLKLMDDLWESLHPSGSLRPDERFVRSDEQKAELDRRLEYHKRHPERAEPWDVVRARLWARLDK
jgi:putative addiction module component (TIGR02574 family)